MTLPKNHLVKASQIHAEPVASRDLGDDNQSTSRTVSARVWCVPAERAQLRWFISWCWLSLAEASGVNGERQRIGRVTSLALIISIFVLAIVRERFVQRHSRILTELIRELALEQVHKKTVLDEPLFDVGQVVVAELDHRS